MSAPTLKQLCEQATQFPVGYVPKSRAECVACDAAGHARQQLAARCSPSTMLAVVEALERARDRLNFSRDGFTIKQIDDALHLLNTPADESR